MFAGDCLLFGLATKSIARVVQDIPEHSNKVFNQSINYQ